MPDFEKDINELFGEKIINDDEFAKRVYAALTNIVWRNGKVEFGGTFRYVGGLIATIRKKGNYMDWYCSAGEGEVDDDIAKELHTKGWTYYEYDFS